MNDPDRSPFSGRKRSPWGWILPSILLHVVILTAILLMPAPEPRQPDERKLTIREDQAEELQERVEEANLEELRKKVAELQTIKAAIAGIREENRARVAGFEETMQGEAPQDIAELLGELAGVYERVHEDYQRMNAILEEYRKWQPRILDAAGRDTVDGLRLLPNLESYWDGMEGRADRFEAAFFETGALMESVKVKLEWMDDPAVAAKIATLELPVETAFTTHRAAWGAVPSSWKAEQSYRFLTEDPGATIETVQRFRREESESLAAVAKARADLEKKITQTEAELARADQAFQSAEAALAALDRNANREGWTAKREEVRSFDRTRRNLGNELQNLKRTLSRTNHQPDQQLARSVKIIEDRLRHSLPDPPDPALITRAMEQQQATMERIQELAASLEGTL